jgi:hypothetical protein
MYNIITDEHFSFIEDHEGVSVVKIEKGEFTGVEYQYKNVRIREEGDEGILSFSYDVINDSGKDVTTTNFTNTIGDILTFVITDAISDESFQIGKKNGNIDSNNDSEEPTK